MYCAAYFGCDNCSNEMMASDIGDRILYERIPEEERHSDSPGCDICGATTVPFRLKRRDVEGEISHNID